MQGSQNPGSLCCRDATPHRPRHDPILVELWGRPSWNVSFIQDNGFQNVFQLDSLLPVVSIYKQTVYNPFQWVSSLVLVGSELMGWKQEFRLFQTKSSYFLWDGSGFLWHASGFLWDGSGFLWDRSGLWTSQLIRGIYATNQLISKTCKMHEKPVQHCKTLRLSPP